MTRPAVIVACIVVVILLIVWRSMLYVSSLPPLDIEQERNDS